MKMGIKSNRLCSAGAALLILLTFLLSAFAGGSVYAETTSENQPIQISSAEELLQFAADAAKDSSINAELTADIDMTGKDAWTSISEYGGTFNGNYHKITGLRCSGGRNTSLFQSLTGTVENLWLEGIDVSGSKQVAGIASNCLGKIQNVFLEGTVTASGDNAGGLVCDLRDPGFIENSCFIGTVTAAGGTIGGVVGTCYTNIKSCYFLGTIQFTSPNATVGLLTGYLHSPTTDYFTYCFCAKNTLIPAIGNVTVPEHVSICEESAFADGTVAAALNGNEGSDTTDDNRGPLGNVEPHDAAGNDGAHARYEHNLNVALGLDGGDEALHGVRKRL